MKSWSGLGPGPCHTGCTEEGGGSRRLHGQSHSHRPSEPAQPARATPGHTAREPPPAHGCWEGSATRAAPRACPLLGPTRLSLAGVIVGPSARIHGAEQNSFSGFCESPLQIVEPEVGSETPPQAGSEGGRGRKGPGRKRAEEPRSCQIPHCLGSKQQQEGNAHAPEPGGTAGQTAVGGRAGRGRPVLRRPCRTARPGTRTPGITTPVSGKRPQRETSTAAWKGLKQTTASDTFLC